MRRTILSLALATSVLGAVACNAQTQPQTAAQANNAIAAQLQNEQATQPPMQDMRGGRGIRRGMHGGGMMRADTNHDGIITRDEAMAAADARFARMDASGDGKVTAEDRQMRLESRGKGPGNGGKRMGRGDPNGDGVMTKQEAEQRAMQRFDRMDTNHDGKLDRTELANFMEMRKERRADRQSDDGQRGDMPPPPPADDNGQ